MSNFNRELVVYFVKKKLSQKNYPVHRIGLSEDANGTESETENGAESPPSSLTASAPRQDNDTDGLDVVNKVLLHSAIEFELRYSCAFGDLSSQLHITPATTYHRFESVMDEVFRDGINWGRILGLFAFGGGLCVQCVEKEMSPLVAQIAEWMTVYLDTHIQPWIEDQGGWEDFVNMFGKDAAEKRQSQESFKRWLFGGIILFTGVVAGLLIAQTRI